MKKFIVFMLVLAVAFSFVSCSKKAEEKKTEAAMSVAMITDYGDITDQSFNQTTYEACKSFSEENGLTFKYYKPAGDSTAERVAMIEQAIDEGFNVIVMPGYAFGEAIVNVAPQYPDVKFVALDVSEGDLGGAAPANAYTMVYQEEIAGYLAGYATVALGYTKLGYCGGMAVPAVIRYGSGFVQGADAAAKKLGKNIDVQYAYAGQFFGDADVTAAMDAFYKNGAEAVFACGGGVFTSVCEAAKKVNGKAVGVDVDQKPTLDGMYGYDVTITSAMKGLESSAKFALKTILDGKWDTLAGKTQNLGLVSGTDMDANYVGIPKDGTVWSSSFTYEDYKAIVADIFNGKTVVDASYDNARPASSSISTYIPSIK